MASRTRQISLKQCYEILRLEKGADLQAVKRAYRKRAFELHPDLNPGNQEASRQFQLLNEAYVALSAMLKPVEEARQKAAHETAEKAHDKNHEQDSQKGREKTAEKPAGDEAEKNGQQSEESDEGSAHAAQHAEGGGTRDASRASAAYAEQDVLRDLLNDPFARRVFEDIYSELNRKQPPPRPESPPPPQPDPVEKKADDRRERPIRRIMPLWERGKEKGVKGKVKDWLRKQIDEEQSLTLPVGRLAPGRRIRLQIRRGMSDEVNSIEVTLPPDFVPGKPVRLRGLGKKVGPWQGDLYLTIHTQ